MSQPESQRVLELLGGALLESAYLPFAVRHAARIGIRVDGFRFLLESEGEDGDVSLTARAAEEELSPDDWVDLDVAALEALAAGKPPTGIAVMRANASEKASTAEPRDPRVDQLIEKAFMPRPYPLADRLELIYPALFGFETPERLWHSPQSGLEVLTFAGPPTIAASLGLSTPGAFTTAASYAEDDAPAGAGYELAVRTSDLQVLNEFVGWVRYVEHRQTNLLPGEWLEYAGGKGIAGTDYIGFVVDRPQSLPPYFPVADREAYWHVLIPVTVAELAFAKEYGVLKLVEQLGEQSPERLL